MEFLSLSLSPVDQYYLNVEIKSSAGEAKAKVHLPFFEGEIDRQKTILKAVAANYGFKADDFQKPGEIDWMLQEGFLADKNSFHPNLYQKIGRELYQVLFSKNEQLKEVFRNSIYQAKRNSSQLHIQIQIYANYEQGIRLSDYPWELLHDKDGFLAHQNVSFSRYIKYDNSVANIPTSEQLKILLISSKAFDNELDLKPLPNREQQAIYQGINRAKEDRNIQLIDLKSATFSEFREYLIEHKDHQAPHVLHFDGHGYFGKRCNNDNCRQIQKNKNNTKCSSCSHPIPKNPQGYLLFSKENSEYPDYISTKELASLIQQNSFGNKNTQLVVLSACQSALALDSCSVFNGIAQNLIRHQIPAVIAMQSSVQADSAAKFFKSFYRSLSTGRNLISAVSQGREAMGIEGNQWYRPILYLRWQDNQNGQVVHPTQSPQKSRDKFNINKRTKPLFLLLAICIFIEIIPILKSDFNQLSIIPGEIPKGYISYSPSESDIRIKVAYPRQWKLTKIEDCLSGYIASFYPLGKICKTNLCYPKVSVRVEKSSYPISLRQHKENSIDQINQNPSLKLIHDNSIFFANQNGYEIMFIEEQSDTSFVKKVLEVVIVRERVAYSIIYEAEEKDYKTFIKDVEKVIQSFVVEG